MIAWSFAALLLVLLAMTALNFFTVVRLDSADQTPINRDLRISVLIPARNESDNLQTLLPALLNSEIRPAEIIVLDDASLDDSFDQATQILGRGSLRFQVLRGEPLTDSSGLTGKNHACAQLARAAAGNILLFCDADVIPSKNAIGRTLQILQRNACAGVSALPFQVTSGPRERLTLPWVVQIPLLTLVPLAYGWKTNFKSLQMANGQWLAVHRDRYDEIGGHQALGRNLVDDLGLARRLTDKTRGGLIPVLSATDVAVRMYSNWDNLVQGFAKNIVQIYGGNRTNFSIGLLIWFALFSFPIWGWLVNPTAALVGGLALVTLRLLGSSLFFNSPRDLLYHFQSLVLLMVLGARALSLQSKKQIEWKGRYVPL